jgi:hypothetical protein
MDCYIRAGASAGSAAYAGCLINDYRRMITLRVYLGLGELDYLLGASPCAQSAAFADSFIDGHSYHVATSFLYNLPGLLFSDIFAAFRG